MKKEKKTRIRFTTGRTIPIAKSKTPAVQKRMDTDEDFMVKFSMACNNGLPETCHAHYLQLYDDNAQYGIGLATLMLEGQSWEQYLTECETDIADMILGGRNPRIQELKDKGLWKEDGPGKKSKKPDVVKSKPVSTEAVSAKEGDACRARAREICEEMGWSLTETGGAILAEDAEGKQLARATYQRGTKNAAWKHVAIELEVML